MGLLGAAALLLAATAGAPVAPADVRCAGHGPVVLWAGEWKKSGKAVVAPFLTSSTEHPSACKARKSTARR